MANKKVIEGTDVTASQLKEFFSQINTGAITRSLLQGFLGQAKKGLLASAVTTAFLTANYFIVQPGLVVQSNFMSLITSAYPDPLVPRGLDGVESFDLSWGSSDQAILVRPEMGGEENVRKHAFTPDQIAALIDEGKESKLLRNGRANLFYVIGKGGVLFVVSVRWYEDLRALRACAWRLGHDGSWPSGCRVFYNTQVFES